MGVDRMDGTELRGPQPDYARVRVLGDVGKRAAPRSQGLGNRLGGVERCGKERMAKPPARSQVLVFGSGVTYDTLQYSRVTFWNGLRGGNDERRCAVSLRCEEQGIEARTPERGERTFLRRTLFRNLSYEGSPSPFVERE
jgi:hypothetical protein